MKKNICSNHHELLEVIEGMKVSSALQELAGSNEVTAARLQAWVQFFQYALQPAKTTQLQTGLQHTLQKNLLWAVLSHDTGEIL